MIGAKLVEAGTGLVEVAGNSLDTFRDHLVWQKKRYAPFPIQDYFYQILTGQISHPVRNAAQLLVDALTVQPARLNPAGIKDYPIFSERDDKLAVKGIPRSIETLMRALQSDARLGSKDQVIVLVAPTGAGKSTVNGVLIDALEKYTDSLEPAPVYGIVGCPINEEPLHAIDKKTRALWKQNYGLEITGHLCPDCRLRAEESVRSSEIGYLRDQTEVPLNFAVQAIPFSLALGRGITRLAPNVTKFMVPNAGELIKNAILGSNRGILQIPELGQHSPEFLKALNDFFRGRKYDSGGKVYETDTVVIADTTLAEWASFFGSSTNQGLLERFRVVDITYPLDPNAELGILKKRLADGRLLHSPHFSPRGLEQVASWAVRTRFRKPDKGTPIPVDEVTKAKLYSGENAGGFTQMDVIKIATEGESAGEGLIGISPPAVWKIVSELVAEQIVGDEETGCVDFVELRKKAKDYIDQAPLPTDVKEQMYKQLRNVTHEYDDWLQQTIEQAFQDRYAERAGQMIQNYLDELGYYLQPKQPRRVDEVTNNPIEPDLIALEKFEKAVTTKGPGGIVAFRNEIFMKAGQIRTEKGRDLKPADFESYFPGFEKGLKDLITNGLGDFKDMLITRTPTKEQVEKLTEMQKRLTEEYGFCAHCAPKLVQYMSNKLRQPAN